MTEFVVNCHLAQNASAAKKFYNDQKSLEADDIAATLVHVLSVPPHVQVSLMLVVFSWVSICILCIWVYCIQYHQCIVISDIRIRNFLPCKKSREKDKCKEEQSKNSGYNMER